MLWFAYFNWRYDWNYRYAKRLRATLFGASPLRRSLDRLAETRLARISSRWFSSGYFLVFGVALLILGISIVFGFGR
jgi:hypothetical protein